MIEVETVIMDKEPASEAQAIIAHNLESWRGNLLRFEGEWILFTLSKYRDVTEPWARECLARLEAGDTSDFVLSGDKVPSSVPGLKREVTHEL